MKWPNVEIVEIASLNSAYYVNQRRKIVDIVCYEIRNHLGVHAREERATPVNVSACGENA